MKIAIVTSNNLPLNAATRKGTEIIVYDLISYLVKNQLRLLLPVILIYQ